MNCEEFACRIPKDNSNDMYCIQTVWYEDKVTISIWDRISVWSGEVTIEALRGFSSTLGVDHEKYFLECKRVLTRNGGDTRFVYSIENSRFVWKKIDPDNNIKVKFGSVEVKNVPFTDEGIAILDHSFNCTLRLNDVLHVEQDRKLKQDEEMKSLEQKLTKLCQEKDLLEKELYVKFLSILNQMKKRIRSLEGSCKQSVTPKKGGSNVMYSDTESDLDDPSSLTCRTSTATSSKQRGKVTPKKTDKLHKRKFEVKQMPLELKLTAPSSDAGDGKDHYDSDTDVDMTTDDEEKPTFNFVSSEPKLVVTNNMDDDLFSEMNSPPAVLPKRMKQNTAVDENGASPSSHKREVKKLPLAEEVPKITQRQDFSTQDLFDDLGQE